MRERDPDDDLNDLLSGKIKTIHNHALGIFNSKEYPEPPKEVVEISEIISRKSIVHLTIECGEPCDICLSITRQVAANGIEWNNWFSPAWSKWIDKLWGKN